jgi:hypothetical protein
MPTLSYDRPIYVYHWVAVRRGCKEKKIALEQHSHQVQKVHREAKNRPEVSNMKLRIWSIDHICDIESLGIATYPTRRQRIPASCRVRRLATSTSETDSHDLQTHSTLPSFVLKSACYQFAILVEVFEISTTMLE